MERVIIIRNGEIFLKGKNREYFESLLIKNIKSTLEGYDFKFSRSQNRYYVEQYDKNLEQEIIDRLKCVFGIHSMSLATKVETKADENFVDIREALKQLAIETDELNTIKNPTFRVTCRRADKKIPMTSSQIAADLGGVVIDNTDFTVNLEKFDYEFIVDIRENHYTFVYTNKIPGAGGLPVGCASKGMLMLSGGIDSPVAAYMMAKRGMKLYAVHFASPPYTSDKARDKVIELRDIVSKYTSEMKLFVVPFTEIQMEIHRLCPAEFMVTIMRRFMMKIATKLAEKCDCKAIITGESLGQVASQTVEGMTSTGEVTNLPIFRPLIAFDKEEIMEIARKINTYETSILPYEDCCTIFLPKNPVIHPKLEAVHKAEDMITNQEELINDAVEKTLVF